MLYTTTLRGLPKYFDEKNRIFNYPRKPYHHSFPILKWQKNYYKTENVVGNLKNEKWNGIHEAITAKKKFLHKKYWNKSAYLQGKNIRTKVPNYETIKQNSINSSVGFILSISYKNFGNSKNWFHRNPTTGRYT